MLGTKPGNSTVLPEKINEKIARIADFIGTPNVVAVLRSRESHGTWNLPETRLLPLDDIQRPNQLLGHLHLLLILLPLRQLR